MQTRTTPRNGPTTGGVAPLPHPEAPEPVVWFDALSRGDTAIAGGKGANLGELTRAGLPVPPGFVITASAFQASLTAQRVFVKL